MSNALIIFIKNPLLGEVKTRLARTIGNEKALQVYRTLLQHTNEVVKDIKANKFVFYSAFINGRDEWDNNIFQKRLQQGNDLGVKMQQAFETVFAEGYQNVCIIGSDCIDITAAIINQAFNELGTADVVIGPATDGGYYLLCMKELKTPLFQNITWSTEQVLNETICICKQLQLSYFLLPQLTDIDVEADLAAHHEKFLFLKHS